MMQARQPAYYWENYVFSVKPSVTHTHCLAERTVYEQVGTRQCHYHNKADVEYYLFHNLNLCVTQYV